MLHGTSEKPMTMPNSIWCHKYAVKNNLNSVSYQMNARSAQIPRFEDFMGLKIDIMVFWVMTSFSLVVGYQHFGGTYYLNMETICSCVMLVPTSTKLQDVITQKITIWRSVQSFWNSQTLGAKQKSVSSVVNFCLKCHLVLREFHDISKELTASTFKHFQLENYVQLKFFKCLLV